MDTTYRNTDLDLVAAFPLDPLANQLTSAGMVQLSTYQDDQDHWHTSFEIVGYDDDEIHANAEATIKAMLAVLEALPEREKQAFAQCKLREFNVAYDVGATAGADGPRDFRAGIGAATLARMAALQTSLLITLYPNAP
ncbi:MAG: hypothetical protein AAGE61_02930 [Pseudomonadota bacterium]